MIAKLRAAVANRAFLLDVAPFIATLCLLWLKLSLFQVALYLIWGSRDPLSEPLETHFEVLGANVTCVLLLGLPLFLFPRVPQFILLLLLNFALTTLVVADTIHVGFYGETTSVWNVKAAVAQVGTILPSVLALIKPGYGILYVDVIAGTLLLPAYVRLSRGVPPAKRRGMVGSFAIASVVGALCAVPSVRLFAQERTGSFAFAYWQREVVASVGLLPYHLWDVRSFLVDALQQHGYRVLAAEHQAAALSLVHAHTGAIDLVIADVVMPGGTGPELVRALAVVRPGVPTLYISGYADAVLAQEGSFPKASHFLQKPFTAAELLNRIRQILVRV